MKKRLLLIAIITLSLLTLGCRLQPEEYCTEDDYVYRCDKYVKVVNNDAKTSTFIDMWGRKTVCSRDTEIEISEECKSLILDIKCKKVC